MEEVHVGSLSRNDFGPMRATSERASKQAYVKLPKSRATRVHTKFVRSGARPNKDETRRKGSRTASCISQCVRTYIRSRVRARARVCVYVCVCVRVRERVDGPAATVKEKWARGRLERGNAGGWLRGSLDTVANRQIGFQTRFTGMQK